MLPGAFVIEPQLMVVGQAECLHDTKQASMLAISCTISIFFSLFAWHHMLCSHLVSGHLNNVASYLQAKRHLMQRLPLFITVLSLRKLNYKCTSPYASDTLRPTR
ncbi:hypothetical protein L6452_13485 [Arctium lappa]|uniref:Uncharacterized protein n=1 Tax=Arctium lappa TaxID=4217 RepID=A0ACB9CIF9_ARCLA|nr:hypothetical protein L6452_13485 [Arctium lappa]